MRQITLSIIACFLIGTSNYAQTEIDHISTKISKIFEKTKAVQELATNKKTVLGQLEDFKNWQGQRLVEPTVSNNLETAYTSYAAIMNTIASEISSDLKELSNYRDIKGVRLDKFVKKFEHKYNDDIAEAYNIYNAGFLPHFEEAATNADSKVGIIGSIALILEFGDTIFNAIKSIFSKDGMSRKSKDMLVELSINLVSKKLVQQLSYPSWSELGMTTQTTSEATTSFSRGMDRASYALPAASKENIAPTLTTIANYSAPISKRLKNRAPIKNNVGLTYYQSNTNIILENVTKGIIVGTSETPTSNMALFTTAAPMRQGDRFWVTLEGNLHAQFYYFDEHLQSWQDPFGKGIIVGGTNTTQAEQVTLPSNSSYFEITDETSQEQFFMLVSNQPMSEIIKTGIIGGSVTGVSFLTALNTMIPLQYPTADFATEKLVLPNAQANDAPVFYGVYITIEKTESQ